LLGFEKVKKIDLRKAKNEIMSINANEVETMGDLFNVTRKSFDETVECIDAIEEEIDLMKAKN
jgi:hypothetical protein